MGQTRLLARAFFTRLFESDLMPDGLPQVQLVLWGALLAATPTSWKALLVTEKYQRLQFLQPLAQEFASDRLTLITLSMMAMGVVGLVIWDGVFPDRRDVRILGPLPVATRRFVAARLTALGQVYMLFAVPVCLMQSLIFPMVVAGFGDPVARLHGVAAHLVTVSAACTFVFAALIAAQCLLLLSFGKRAAQHVSVAFQLLFAVGLVQLLVFLPDLGRVLRESGGAREGLSAVALIPPTWFFGMYEVLAGTADPGTAVFGHIAIGATVGALLLAGGLYAASYDLLSRRALEGPPPRSRHARRERLAGLLRRFFTPGLNAPVRAAVRQFTVRTIARSRYHRMMLAVYAGIALAIVFSSALSVAVRDNGAGFWRPGITMLSMPLIFQFLMLIGIRVIIAVPSEPKARWLFRACEPSDRYRAIAGGRDTMMLLVVLPTAVFALVQGLVFWNVPAALSHAAFCWVMGRLLTEVLLLRTDKLPFACTYYPGKSRVFTLWPLYVMAFFLYTVLFAAIDLALTTRPRGLAMFCGASTLITAGLMYRRWRTLAALQGLRFEEEDPDLMFQGFNLSEAMAAAPRSPSATSEPADATHSRTR
ncbi:MAG: hypothetical protein ACRD1U_07515 [Vicinamibacterales bacterium]